MSNYLYKVEPIDEWYHLYRKYRSYVYARVKDFTLEEKDDLYSSLWLTAKNAERTYKEFKGMSKKSWFLMYIKTAIQRFLKSMNKKYATEINIDSLDEKPDYFIGIKEDFNMDYNIDEEMLRSDVRKVLNTIPQPYRDILKFYYGIGVERKNYIEIAKLSGTTTSNIQSKAKIGLRYLKSRFLNVDRYKYIGEIFNYEA